MDRFPAAKTSEKLMVGKDVAAANSSQCPEGEHVLALENILRGAKKPVRLLILAVYVVVMNDGAEIDILNRLGTRPQDCWRPPAQTQYRGSFLPPPPLSNHPPPFRLLYTIYLEGL